MNEMTTYASWHRTLGHGEYRVRITMTGHGDDDDAAVDFLDGFLTTSPECGPVVSQNSADDTISITIGLRAKDAENAVHLGAQVWIEGGEASGVEAGEVVRVEVDRVPEEEHAEITDTEFAPA